MFIIDLDGTLYNTHLLTKKITEIFCFFGIPEDVAQKTFKTATITDSTHFDYTFERHIAKIVELGYVFDQQKALQTLETVFEENFVDDEAKIFLDRLKKFQKKLILLTAGNPAFQKKKFDSTELGHMFDRTVFVHGDKPRATKDIIRDTEPSSVFFINDKVVENIAVKKVFTDMRVITKNNRHKELPDVPDTMHIPQFSTLLEIADYVESET